MGRPPSASGAGDEVWLSGVRRDLKVEAAIQLRSPVPLTPGPQPIAAEDERSLVQRAQRGEEAALTALLQRFSRPLYAGVILPRVGAPSEADEILAHTLSRAALKLDDFRYTEQQGIWPWMRRIAMNAIIDRARRRKVEAGGQERYGAEVEALAPRVSPGAEALFIEEEERRDREERLRRALLELNDRYRRAIELRIFEEKSREECAAILEVTVGTFDVLLHRAVSALKKTFGDVM